MASQMQLEDWLDDLCVRFIINIPEEDLSSVARICFQVEEAQWFYEDFIRPLDASLPSMSLRIFCLRIFKHCPLLAHFSEENHLKAFEDFLEYKTRIPVRGAIMLNHEMDSAVLVKGWKKSASWTFPAGKINKAEGDLDCAIREVWEETGLDLQASGLIHPERTPEYIELPIRGHLVRLYIFRHVPMDYDFQPQTRKEISRIDWYKLSDLPAFRKKSGQNHGTDAKDAGVNSNKYYLIAPFMPPLRKWVAAKKREEQTKAMATGHGHLAPPGLVEEEFSETEQWNTSQNHLPDGPAIETLDGASQELRRLLKMQVPGDGLQRPPQMSEMDKGSALLSVLQAKGATAPAAGNPFPSYSQHQPRAPYDATTNQAHQATSHSQHHVHPVPQQSSSSYPAHHFPISGTGQQQQEQEEQQRPTIYQQVNPPLQGRGPVALVHPQPLPPQLQSAVFRKGAFHEPSLAHNTQASPQAKAAPVPSFSKPSEPSVAEAMSIRPVQPETLQSNASPLNGRSQALLNAFKRNPPAQQLEEQQPGHAVKRPSVEVAVGLSPHHPPHYSQYGVQPPTQAAPAAPHQANTSQPLQHKYSPEVAGPGGYLPQSQQKSTLLGLFKKAASNESPKQHDQYQQQQHDSPLGQPAYASQMENSAFQNGSLYGKPDQSTQATLEKRMENLAPFFQTATSPTKVETVSPARRFQAMPSTSHPAQNQPIRILQRGQRMESVEDRPIPAPHDKPPPSEFEASVPHPATFPTLATAISSTDAGAGGGSDQKRQLLSLFGPKSSPGSQAGDSSAPAKRGENPMSPADQSFLLDYLQSVTTNAK